MVPEFIVTEFKFLISNPGDHDFRDHNATMQRCENFGVGDVYYPMSDKDPDTMKSKNVDPEEAEDAYCNMITYNMM